jgi:hypothetical protein
MEPDMEDLTAIIPFKFDFVDDIDDIFDEDEHQQYSAFSQPVFEKN